MGELVDRDQEHLRLLMWAHYLMAAFLGFLSMFAVFYIAIGGMMASGAFPQQPQYPANDPRIAGMVFVVIGLIFLVLGLTISFLTFFAGRSIRDRRRHTYCLIVAGLSCLHIPIGTILGVCTINVLNRPEVKLLFGHLGPPPTPATL